MRKLFALMLLSIWGSLFAAEPAPPIEITHPWARATVPGQAASGAFMEIRSPVAAVITGLSSPVAGVVQIHEMVANGDRMSMRPVARLTLPASTTVELRPNGMHVMLLDLRVPLSAGQHFPLTFEISEPGGRKAQATVDVEVRALGSTP
ncbi:MAG: copper chaperone PCu(A)C [Burkholderiaceae bacterium]|jgi:copper(I)-binding protein